MTGKSISVFIIECIIVIVFYSLIKSIQKQNDFLHKDIKEMKIIIEEIKKEKHLEKVVKEIITHEKEKMK